ncbi:MAG: hypothetical protein KIT84_36595 [Labilithrix sp.]|nr:hypothetical protein [Labilithrix sp.]MCW5816576.1 hypothetical protein [Labilithrix sp.]
MSLRRAALLFSALACATACTALIGLEDLPPAPMYDAGPTPTATTPGQEAGPPDAGDGAAAIQAAIAEYTRAFCARYKECRGPDFEFSFRNVDDCVAANNVSVAWGHAMPGSIATAKSYQDCAANVRALTCATFGSSDGEFACALRGTRKVDERCLANQQCESGICGSDENTCRGCVNPPDNGQPCAAGDQCGAGLVCNSAKRCVTQAGTNQSCSDEKPCVYPDGCDNGTCKPLPATAGAPCSAAGCDTTKGFVCVGGTCRTYTISGPGGSCVTTGNAPQYCRFGVACSDAGVCADAPKEGDACGGTSPPYCPWPLRCVNEKCAALPAASTCQ